MVTTEHRWDFFIAHAGADVDVAEAMYERLYPLATVFLDSRCLSPGDPWDQALPSEQAQSCITVVLISEHTDAAYYQREEIASAINLARKDGARHLVVPLHIGSGAQIKGDNTPYGLRVRHALSLTDRGGLEGVCKKLLRLRDNLKRERLKSKYTELGNLTSIVNASGDEWWVSEPERKGVLLVREPNVAVIWDRFLRRIIGDRAPLLQELPEHFETPKSLIDLLSHGYAFVMLPLTLPRYNSLRLAEFAHRLSSPTRIIAVTSTEAPRGMFEPLFDAFVPTSEFSVQSLTSAIRRAPRRNVPMELIELSIEKILSTANCFVIPHYHGDHRPTLSHYKNVIAGEKT